MTAEGIAGVQVDDELILVTGNRYRGDEAVTVSRVGRQYIYVASNGREMRERFDRSTGVQDGTHGVRARLCTQAQYDESKQRVALFEKLREAGVDVRHEVRSGMSTSKLRGLLAVVEED